MGLPLFSLSRYCSLTQSLLLFAFSWLLPSSLHYCHPQSPCCLGYLLFLFTLVLLWYYLHTYECLLATVLVPILFFYLFSFLFFSFSSPNTFVPCSITQYLYPSSFLLFLVLLLFYAIVVVVSVLDLSLGGFTA